MMTKKPILTPLPSREEILAFIAREREVAGERAPAKIGKREIARAFQLKGADKIGLKRILKEMEEDGAVERRRKGLTKPGALPPTSIAEIFTRDRDGRPACQADRLGRGAGSRADHRHQRAAQAAPRHADARPRRPRAGAHRADPRRLRQRAGLHRARGQVAGAGAHAGARHLPRRHKSGCWRPGLPRRQEDGQQGRAVRARRRRGRGAGRRSRRRRHPEGRPARPALGQGVRAHRLLFQREGGEPDRASTRTRSRASSSRRR